MVRRNAGVRIAALALLSVLTLLASSSAGHAFNTITVRVTVNSAETFGACWDSFCNKPDLFVVFYGQSATAQAPLCKSNTVVDRVSVGSPSPNDWFCGFVVQRPGKIFIGLYDGDGPNSNNTAAEQVDVAPGAELAAGVDVEIPAVANAGPVTSMSQGDHGKIRYTVSAVINPGELGNFSADRPAFRPSAGERIVLTAFSLLTTELAKKAPVSHTVLRVRAYDDALPPREVWSVSSKLLPGQDNTKFVWQGRDASGDPLPPGTYTLKLDGFDDTTGSPAIGPLPGSPTPTVGGFRTLTVRIDPPPVVPALTFIGIDPGFRWAPEVGDLRIRFSTSADATVSGEAFASTSCSGQRLAYLGSLPVRAARTYTLTWDGQTAGSRVANGMYSIKLSGLSGGAPTDPAFRCVPVEVVSAPAAMLYVQHAPFLLSPGHTATLTAKSVDPTGAPRVVGSLSVWVSKQAISLTAPSPPSNPLRTCTFVASCSVTIVVPPGPSFVSWKTTATDRDGSTIASFGWRGQAALDFASLNLVPATGFAVPVEIALTGPALSDQRDPKQSLDLLFSVSTDFDWSSATDRRMIDDALDRFMVRMWGVTGPGAPDLTTFLSRPELVRIYLTPEQHAVSWTPPANLCDWSAPEALWVDVIAVLHRTNCRDNTIPADRSFSAKLQATDVIFHELHHALFGLADEYPDGTGGYFERQPFPNVFATLAGCTAVSGRNPSGCTSIVEQNRVTGAATGRTFFRLDFGSDDIMVNNGPQLFADRARANWKESECDAGRC